MNTASIIQKAILSLGLSDIEARVYEWLVTNPRISISLLAKELNLNRTQVYNALENLAVIGLINKDTGRTKNFTVEPPSKLSYLLDIVDHNLQSIKKQVTNVLPDVMFNFQNNSSSQTVRIYQGTREFNALFLEMYDQAKSEILFMGDSDSFADFIDKNFIDYAVSKRVERGIRHRVLTYPPARSLQSIKHRDVQDLREVRLLNKTFVNPGYINIFGSKVVNWNPVLAKAVVIEDTVIAEFHRSIFEQLWSDSQPR